MVVDILILIDTLLLVAEQRDVPWDFSLSSSVWFFDLIKLNLSCLASKQVVFCCTVYHLYFPIIGAVFYVFALTNACREKHTFSKIYIFVSTLICHFKG